MQRYMKIYNYLDELLTFVDLPTQRTLQRVNRMLNTYDIVPICAAMKMLKKADHRKYMKFFTYLDKNVTRRCVALLAAQEAPVTYDNPVTDKTETFTPQQYQKLVDIMQPYIGVHTQGFYMSGVAPTGDNVLSLGRIPFGWSVDRVEQLYIHVQNMLKHNIPESTILDICASPNMPVEQLRLFLTPLPQ